MKLDLFGVKLIIYPQHMVLPFLLEVKLKRSPQSLLAQQGKLILLIYQQIKVKKAFTLHYNFPPFSTGEARPLRGTSRREVGHGNLAQRALKKVIPNNCPYTVRIVSEILESNGSSSMATVCAGSLALMDAGIQISDTVSGIAMGLITDGKRFAVLSDILGDEDHLVIWILKLLELQRELPHVKWI